MIIIPLGPIIWLSTLPFRVVADLLGIRLDGYNKAKEKYVPRWVKNAVDNAIFANNQDFMLKLKGKRYRWKVFVSYGILSKVKIRYYSKRRKRYKSEKK